MATTEKFEYDSVRSSMDSVISDKTVFKLDICFLSFWKAFCE